VSDPTRCELTGGGRLTLLDVFGIKWQGVEVTLPVPAQRLLACLALHPRAPRARLAGLLWPETNEHGALRNLRTAIWCVQRTGVPLLARGRDLTMAAEVAVDVNDLLESVADIRGEPALVPAAELSPRRLDGELLTGWYDDWVLLERERLRQLQLHALESAAWELCRRGCFGPALDAAVAAVQREPLRETAQFLLVSVHLAEGNPSEALRQFDRYSSLLRTELGITPSERFCALVQPLLAPRALARRDRDRRTLLTPTV
jgi:DNA-binding SARP family transcriptional activator